LSIGLPGLGGILGSLAVRPLLRRYRLCTVLLATGTLRTLWLGFIPLAPPGTARLVVIVAADMPLCCAGAFNPVFATYRMTVT
jgi:hypothetical protein